MIKTFLGGTHIPSYKTLTKTKKIDTLFIADRVSIALLQHIGAECRPIVKKGDKVIAGDLIAESDQFVSAPIHASISGEITDVGKITHPISGKTVSVINIKRDENIKPKEWVIKSEDIVNKLDSKEIINKVKQSGIVGLGGAAFPTHVKLSPPPGKNIDTLIINAAECEPYLTCDYRIMIEKPHEIIKGIMLIAKVLNVSDIYIGMEANKKDAAVILERTLNEMNLSRKIKIVLLKNKYPQGGEKQLIYAITRRIVQSKCLPMDVGVCVNNVGTAYAVYESIYKDKPLIERVVTFTGDAFREPRNLLLPIGAIVTDVINYCGGFIEEPQKLIMGGPMMGFAQYSAEIPIIKGTSGILAMIKDQSEVTKEYPCLRCGKCISVCPVGLKPTVLAKLVENERYDELEKAGIFDCIECGACDYLCPSKNNLVELIKKGKNILNRRKKAQVK